MSRSLPDLSKSLQDLDGEDWGEPNFDSHLVTECHRLHRTPLRDFEAADLRRMIGQNLCLDHLVPLALQQLTQNPLLDAEYDEGDLLRAVLTVDQAFWVSHPELQQETWILAERAGKELERMSEDERHLIAEAFQNGFGQFIRNTPSLTDPANG